MLVIAIPDKYSASFLFGVRINRVDNNESVKDFEGAGFRIIRAPFLKAIAAIYSTVSNGVSSCISTKLNSFIASAASCRSAGSKIAFAPDETTIQLSPFLSTVIRAIPVACSVSVKTKAVLIPSSSNTCNNAFPNRSVPIFEISVTRPPSLEAATA